MKSRTQHTGSLLNKATYTQHHTPVTGANEASRATLGVPEASEATCSSQLLVRGQYYSYVLLIKAHWSYSAIPLFRIPPFTASRWIPLRLCTLDGTNSRFLPTAARRLPLLLVDRALQGNSRSNTTFVGWAGTTLSTEWKMKGTCIQVDSVDTPEV